MYYIYMLRCEDNSIYTGITNNLERRMFEHFTKDKNCAKYTAVHTAKKVEAIWIAEDRKFASKLEFHIKTLNKNQKEQLINDNNKFENFLRDKIDYEAYKRYSLNEINEILINI